MKTRAVSEKRTKFRKRSQEEEIPVGQDRNRTSRTSGPHLRSPPLDQKILQLLKHRVLQHGIDNEHQSRTKPTEEPL
jgi:hypothetical protein